ncbi:MAG: Modification methylase LlaDCHIA [Candidatus Hydrogenedentota bacterium]
MLVTTAIREPKAPRPFLKWVGGKGQLLGELLPRVEAACSIERYHEFFLGGGALFFHLSSLGMLGRQPPQLSDANQRLIEVFDALRKDANGVLAPLREHARLHSPEHYYATRASVPDTPAARAARIIYLNRTCFNGLYRENSRGEFNVPMGRYDNPLICDAANLRAVSVALKRARITCQGFEQAAEAVAPGDFVYLDPPYDPVSETANFTSYHAMAFGREQQRQLAATYRMLDQRGARLLLSNSDTPFIRELYAGFRIEVVMASRNVNSRADRRGRVAELLIRNY